MTKDMLIKLLKMYMEISDRYMHEYPSDEVMELNSKWKEEKSAILKTWRRQGKMQLLRELIGLVEGEENA